MPAPNSASMTVTRPKGLYLTGAGHIQERAFPASYAQQKLSMRWYRLYELEASRPQAAHSHLTQSVPGIEDRRVETLRNPQKQRHRDSPCAGNAN